MSAQTCKVGDGSKAEERGARAQSVPVVSTASAAAGAIPPGEEPLAVKIDEKNIYDFCLRQKASKDFHYEGLSNGKRTVYNKLIRYYVSNKGEKLLKIKNPECQSNAPDMSQVEAGEWVMHVCNHLTPDHPLDNINYAYYIERAEKIISKIQLEGKKRKVIVNPNQMSLF